MADMSNRKHGSSWEWVIGVAVILLIGVAAIVFRHDPLVTKTAAVRPAGCYLDYSSNTGHGHPVVYTRPQIHTTPTRQVHCSKAEAAFLGH